MSFPEPPPVPKNKGAYNASFADVMEYTGLKEDVLTSWIESGFLPLVRRGQVRYFPDAHVKWLKAFLHAHITLPKAAIKYRIAPETLSGWIASGKLDAFRLRNRIYLEESNLQIFAVPEGDELLKRGQAAALLGVEPTYLGYLCRMSRIESRQQQPGCHHLFLRSDVLALKEELRLAEATLSSQEKT